MQGFLFIIIFLSFTLPSLIPSPLSPSFSSSPSFFTGDSSDAVRIEATVHALIPHAATKEIYLTKKFTAKVEGAVRTIKTGRINQVKQNYDYSYFCYLRVIIIFRRVVKCNVDADNDLFVRQFFQANSRTSEIPFIIELNGRHRCRRIIIIINGVVVEKKNLHESPVLCWHGIAEKL